MSSRQSPGNITNRRVGPKASSTTSLNEEETGIAATPPGSPEEVTAVSEPARTVYDKPGQPNEMVTEVSSVEPGATSAEPAIGDLISGRYRLEKVLGEGGMGKVFLAQDELYAGEFKDRHAQVALKFLGKKFASHSVSRMALQRETRKSQQLAHPNVVRVMHFDQHAGNPYMIMEYMHGEPLDGFLDKKASAGLPLQEALELIEGMALGLGYIHSEGLVHSDFKPNNVIVGEDGTAKILDLGIARVNVEGEEKQRETTFDVSALGALTPTYASCEMFEGQKPDPRDDIYALACVIYELLAGHHPFHRTPALKARADEMKPKRLEHLSRDRWHALEKGLAFNRDDRTASAAALLDGLRGDKTRRKLVLGGLSVIAGLAVLAAISLGLVAMKPEDPDQVFMNKLGALSAQATELTAGDSERIQRWLEQGTAYLDIARDVFEQGDMLSAHQILLAGADNARSAFMSVLQLSNSEEARQGMMDLVNLYAQWTQTKLQEGKALVALWMACQGLSVHPTHEALLDFSETARADMPDAANTDCAFMLTQTP